MPIVHKKPKQELKIRGLMTELWQHNKSQSKLLKRKMITPEWLSLWFKVSDGLFDKSLWLQLSSDNQNYLYRCYKGVLDLNRDFEQELANKFSNDQKRLAVLEGLILSGNLNPAIATEFGEILDRFVDSNQINRLTAENFKRKLGNTIKFMKKTD